jgi:hypothetical protein
MTEKISNTLEKFCLSTNNHATTRLTYMIKNLQVKRHEEDMSAKKATTP